MFQPRISLYASFVSFLAVCLWQTSAFGQAAVDDQQRAQQLKDLFQQVAGDYEVTAGSDAELVRLPLRREPIMHWLSNEGMTGGAYVGSVFVWTHKSRPALVTTIFTSNSSLERLPVSEESYSFSPVPISVRSGRGAGWQSQAMGPMAIIPGAPLPAETEQGRRLQIRNMVRQFSGRMNRRGVHHPLRLLPRPVYEYEVEDDEVLTGALFVLVAYTTDPDILLLVEARRTAEGPRWCFQPARFSDKSLWLDYQEQNVWTSLRQGHGSDAPHPADPQYHVENSRLDAPLKPTEPSSATADRP